MGYCVNLIDADFKIPETTDVLQALKDLNHQPGIEKNGGSYGPNGVRVKWFSWMPPDYDQTVTSVQEVFDLLGFETDTSDPSYVALVGYDNKSGQEELFLETVAPYMCIGSHVTWRGEDGALWKHVVDLQGKLLTLQGKVIFDDTSN